MRNELIAAISKVNAQIIDRANEIESELPKQLLKMRVAITHLRNLMPPDAGGTEKAADYVLDTLEAVEHIVAMNLWENAKELHEALHLAAALAVELPDGGPHKLTDPAVREAVLKLTDGKCTYCGTPIGPPGPHNDVGNFVVEHVVPKSKGGPDNIVNFVPACRGCNNAKGDRHVLHFITNVLPSRVAKAGGGL